MTTKMYFIIRGREMSSSSLFYSILLLVGLTFSTMQYDERKLRYSEYQKHRKNKLGWQSGSSDRAPA
jgi:hypothetical protein